jgi:hypothetical protein
MNPSRETIYSRVFAFFSALTVGGAPAFKVATRKLTQWDGLGGEDQPALMMRQRTETARYQKGIPVLWTLGIDLYMYVSTGAQNDMTIIPSQILNPLLDALESALVHDDPAMATCTLGGVVSHCSIDGPIEIYEGTMGDEAVALVPITVLVPASS